MQVTRDSLKYNFLRRIIIRIDYSGIVDIKSGLNEIHNNFINYGFVKMREEFIQEAEFKLDDPIMIDGQGSIPIKEIQKTETFKYASADEDLILEINRFFTTLSINAIKYRDFNEYIDIFSNVVSLIKSKNTFMNPLRLGVRKINDCILLNKNKFDYFFNERYFRDIAKDLSEDGIDVKKLNTSIVDNIYKDDISYNYIRNCTEGTLSNGEQTIEGYQVVVDIDGYTQNNDRLNNIISNKLCIDNFLSEINENLFNLYKFTLSNQFIELLQTESTDFEDKEILGVEKND
ncbi:TIGR04255 family protein [Paraclostridium bifermentans]|uniref:TIGR04255 family protein n=1 Tax=Paraclostridium bifermentans TaxID=1490 RepID=UPI001FF51300|nr:TIGR04255 family protein [Paraclostridium bifermentans]UOW67235.1 TIGR04255 family protein [Paraclostridium bifermentans]